MNFKPIVRGMLLGGLCAVCASCGNAGANGAAKIPSGAVAEELTVPQPSGSDDPGNGWIHEDLAPFGEAPWLVAPLEEDSEEKTEASDEKIEVNGKTFTLGGPAEGELWCGSADDKWAAITDRRQAIYIERENVPKIVIHAPIDPSENTGRSGYVVGCMRFSDDGKGLAIGYLPRGAGPGVAAYVDLETGESVCARLRGRPLSVNFVRGDTLLWLSWNERREWRSPGLEMTRTDGTGIDGFNRGDRYLHGRLANAAMRKGTDVLLVRSEEPGRRAYVAAIDVSTGRQVEATEEDAEALASVETFRVPWRFLGERHPGTPSMTVRLSIEDRADVPRGAPAKEVASDGAPITRVPDDETWGVVTAAEGALTFRGALEREAGTYALFAHRSPGEGDALLALDIDANGNLKETMRFTVAGGDDGLSAAIYAYANGYLYRIWEGYAVAGRCILIDRIALSGAGENRRIALGGAAPFEAHTVRLVPAADGGCFILIPRDRRDGYPSVCRLDAAGSLSWAKTLIFEPAEGELGAPFLAELLGDGIAVRHHDTVITLSADGETVARRRYPAIGIPENTYRHLREGTKLSVVAFDPRASRATILRLGEANAVTRFVLSPSLASSGLEFNGGADTDSPPRSAYSLLDGGAHSADPLRFLYVKDRAIRARLEANGAYFIRNAEDRFLAFCTTTDALPSVARQSVLVKRWAIGGNDFFGSVSARISFKDGARSEELPITLAEAGSIRAVATNEGELQLERNYRGVTMRAFVPPAYAKDRTR